VSTCVAAATSCFQHRSRIILCRLPVCVPLPSLIRLLLDLHSLTSLAICFQVSRDSSVGAATGYWLDDRGVGVRVPVGWRIFTSPCRPDRLWASPNLLSDGCRELFPGGKAAGAWSWPFTSSKCRGQENVDLYIHSPMHLHGIMLN
jgi:hypothetical protein